MAKENIEGVSLDTALSNVRKSRNADNPRDGGDRPLSKIGKNSGFYFDCDGDKYSVEKKDDTSVYLDKTGAGALARKAKLAVMSGR